MQQRQRKLGHRAQRTGFFSENKWTNMNCFDPYDHASDLAYFAKYYDVLNAYEEKDGYLVRSEPTHHKFIMPITPDDVRSTLSQVPAEFLEGLKGVVLLAGSNKQYKTHWGRLACFGQYGYKTIFIFPCTKYELVSYRKSLPPPHIRQEYERAGAKYTQKGNRWIREFSMEALKTYYLNDVLLHELGHHVDRSSDRSGEKAERFADWFAVEYGYKFRG